MSQRIRPLLTPTPDTKRDERGRFADAASRRILSKINSGEVTEPVRRVLWLLQALQTAETMRLQLFDPSQFDWSRCGDLTYEPPYSGIRNEFVDSHLQTMNLRFQRLMEEIEQGLKRYHWSPTVRCGGFLGLATWYTWRKSSDWRTKSGLRYPRTAKVADDDWENWAVFWLIKHAEQGSSGRSISLILRFRQCRHCQIWFYALTDHQQHCSERCRKAFHSQSPEFRKKRRLYMEKIWRPQHKAREARAKAAAQKLAAERKKGKA